MVLIKGSISDNCKRESYLQPPVVSDDGIYQEEDISNLVSQTLYVPVEVLVNEESLKELENLK